MKKKFLSSFLFAALVGGAISTFTACSDYDDDIKNLQEQIDENAKLISGIEDLIKSGSVITSVTSIENGVKVILSDGKEFTVTNGTDGANGTVWTISEDGYWVKDGVKTEYKALGEKGDKGDKGEQGAPGADGKDGINGTNGADGKDGEDGKDGAPGADGKDGETVYYKPDGTGYFDQYKLDADGKEVLVKDNAVCYLEEGVVTAVMDNEFLTLSGIKTADGKGSVQISLTGDLRSLVFQPKMYLDGVEAVKYPWLQTTDLKNVPNLPAVYRGKDVKNTNDYQTPATPVVCNYGPVWPVDYHMNPSNSNVKSEDVVVPFYMLDTDVYYRTRASKANYSVEYREEKDLGGTVFNNEDGVLTVGMKVLNPQNLVSKPTENETNKDQVIALQVKSNSTAAKDGVVTSDYALIRPMKTVVEGLVWAEKPMYCALNPAYIHPANRKETGDEVCSITGTKIHVFDTPQKAFKDAETRGAALELYYDSEEGITISEYMGVCWKQEDVHPNKTELNTGIWKFGEEADYGLTYDFKLVDYFIDGNETGDSRYAKIDPKTGKIVACNVNDKGETVDTRPVSKSVIGRQPMVQVLVKDYCGNVVLDGYILVNISGKGNKIFDWNKEDKPTVTFDLCNGKTVITTTWGQFHDRILNALDEMTKNSFDVHYEIDEYSDTGVEAGNGTTVRLLNIYTDDEKYGIEAATVVADNYNYGTVEYLKNTEGTTNHVFKWIVPAELLEAWTHHQTNLPVEKSIYVRYKAIPGSGAEYPYIYIKFTAKFTRADVGKVKFGEKINNYWFALNGSDSGFEAIVNDIQEPRDEAYTLQFQNLITKTLVNNEVAVKNGKFYFVPNEEYTITAQDGTTYTVTAQSSSTDKEYKTLYCKYVYDNRCVDQKHDFNKATLDKLLNECAIDYTKGTFANNALYARDAAGKYTKIVTLDQTTGILTLQKYKEDGVTENKPTKDVLNAVGYAENHANLDDEMRGWIGFVAENNCGVAKQVEDNIFLASWQRPINMVLESRVAHDATTNGVHINILDLLKLYDWRGPVVGYMWGDHQWFWAYYGVKAITIDLDPDHVTTDMHGGTLGSTTLGSISDKVDLWNEGGKDVNGVSAKDRACTATYSFGDNIKTYNKSTMNSTIVSVMKDDPVTYGGIYYQNNGENVKVFTVRIPVTVEYEWGKLIEKLDLTIERTLGN